MSCCVFSQEFYKKKNDTLVEISLKDVRKIVLLKNDFDECKELKNALIDKIQQDSVLIEKQQLINQSLKGEVSILQRMNNQQEQSNNLLKNELAILKQKNRRNMGFLGSVGVLLFALLLVK